MENEVRLVDANEFEKRIEAYNTDDAMDKALYSFAHLKMLCTPTVDARVNVYGNWIKCEDKQVKGFSIITNVVEKCSICGIRNASKYKNFCPNCGADMRGTTDAVYDY